MPQNHAESQIRCLLQIFFLHPNFPINTLSRSNFTHGIQPPKRIKAVLKANKYRDGKTGKNTLYFDYPRSKILMNEEYMDQFGEVMKI